MVKRSESGAFFCLCGHEEKIVPSGDEAGQSRTGLLEQTKWLQDKRATAKSAGPT
jgi:hypothetical protein